MSNRYKVWSLGESGRPGALLLRTGTPKDAPDFGARDYGCFTGSPADVATLACVFAGVVDTVLVKDFDTDRCYTVVSSGEVTEGWEP